MLEISVYSSGVLRYIVIGNWDKAQKLRNQGYFVQARPVYESNAKSGADNLPDHFASNENGNAGVHDRVGIQPGINYKPDYY